jgi:transcriptional regulator with XRE-family HTH domain
MNNITKDTIDTLVGIRIRKGLTQKEVAKRMGCGQSKVCKIENRYRHYLSLDDLVKYAAACECRIHITIEDTHG